MDMVSAGKRRPRLVLELGHVAAEVGLDGAILHRRDDEIRTVDRAGDTEPREAHQRRSQVLDAGVGDADLRLGDRGEPDERADLDVVRADSMGRAAEASPAFDRELVGARCRRCPHRGDEEMTEVLDVRLAGRVPQDRRAAGGDRGDERRSRYR
jgi:hypothetical protein